MHKNILIAEDDHDIKELLTLYLESNDFKVFLASDGCEALKIFNAEKIDLALIDIMMPNMSGYELVKEIRKVKNIPIIIMSAKSMDTDKVLGLNLGADAYITKPFNPLEVIAYINALLRRCYDFNDEIKDVPSSLICIGELCLDLEKYLLRKNNNIVPLTSTEIKILSMLMKSPERVFTKAKLYECINGDIYANDENTMMVHISNLRAKIEDDPANPKYIKTVRGLGYKFEDKKK